MFVGARTRGKSWKFHKESGSQEITEGMEDSQAGKKGAGGKDHYAH